jgi:4-carboxymuconolactone decarboxylase
MSRLQPLADADMTPQQLEFAEGVRAARAAGNPGTSALPSPLANAGLGGPLDAMLRSPGLGVVYRQLARWGFALNSIPRELAEFTILLVLRHWDSQFPFWAHTRLAREAGVPDDIIEAIRLETVIPFEDPRQRVVHDFLKEYFATNRVSEDTYARLLDSFDESAVMDLIGLVGSYTLTAMATNVFDIGPGAGEPAPLPERG